MSDETTIVDVETRLGRFVVEHVITSKPGKFGLLQVAGHYEVSVDGVVKHTSKDPEDIMRALGQYMASLAHEIDELQESINAEFEGKFS